MVTHANDENFEKEVIQSNLPVLVDFWADWCGPCKMISPILDEISVEFANKLKVVKVNVDHSAKIPAQYAVRGIPTLILFKNGNVEATKVGALSKNQVLEFLDSHV